MLAAELYIVECHPVEYRANMEMKGDDIDISFLTTVPNTIRVQLEQVEVASADMSPVKDQYLGPTPDTQAADFYFEERYSTCLLN